MRIPRVELPGDALQHPGLMFLRLLLICALWAAIYLPWLGASGLRSEEPKRVMPAVEMLETGDFLVPRIAGEPFLRKPPLINWLVAASFKITGARNDWIARLPSALSVLVVAFAFVVIMRRDLGDVGSLAAAIAWLTNLGMIEKGRMMEIDAVYVALFAFAFLCWLHCWRAGRSPWLTWIAPWIFLGFGMLAKGPAHLFFFYALIAAILWQTGKLRVLFHPAHLLGIVVMVAIFAAWALPYSRAIASPRIAHAWSGEVISRFTGDEIDFRHWALNFPLGLAYFLPFGLFLPFIRPNEMKTEALLARGLVLGSLVPFCLVLLLPGALPRYILPTLIPACLLFGLTFKTQAFYWQVSLGKKRLTIRSKVIWPLAIMIALAAMIIFPLRSATTQREHSIFRKVAAPIDALVPANVPLYAVGTNLQPYLFYVRAPVRYLRSLDDLPPDARYLIVPPMLEEKVESMAQRQPHLLARTQAYRRRETLLFAVDTP